MREALLYSIVLGFCGGIFCRSFLYSGIPLISLLLLVAVLLGVVFVVRRKIMFLVVAIGLLAASFGVLRLELVQTGLPPGLQAKLNQEVVLEGKVVEDPDVRESNQRVVIETDHARVLAVAPLYPPVSFGESVVVQGMLTEPEPFDTDGDRVFRYDHYLAKDGVYGMVENAKIEVVGGGSTISDAIYGALIDFKHAGIHALESALPEPHSSLASGLLLGGKQGLGKQLLDAFTVVGLVHIVVLSGYNIMIIAEAVLRATSTLPRRVSAAFSVVVIAAFVFVAGASAAALRAGLMAGIALLARATGRTYEAIRALAVAVVVMLLLNPLLLGFDPGFQLSVIATLGLILGTPITETWFKRVEPSFVREVLATTVAAQIAVLPLLLFQTGNLSLVSLLANVLVLPTLPLAMATSFLAGAVGLIVPYIAPILGLPAYILLGYVIETAKTLAAMPYAQLTVPAFPFVLVVIAYALLGHAVWKITGKS